VSFESATVNPRTERRQVAGPMGAIDCAIDRPAATGPAPGGLALLCHPHPLHGGTMDNKVVQTLARAAVACGWTSVRFNFRGVGASEGRWAEGAGEVDDVMAVLRAVHSAGQPLLLGGFSFGGAMAARAARRLTEGSSAGAAVALQHLLLIAPAAQNFPLPPAPAAPTRCLVVHGEHDEIVPLHAVLDWARPQSLPVTVLPGAGHFFHGMLPQLKQIVVDALRPPGAPGG
jgi:uncharacterized protein